MSRVRRRGARLAGALSLIALLLVPAALATHVHADPFAARSCAVCVAAHHSPAVTSRGPAVAEAVFLAAGPPRRPPRAGRARGPCPAAPGARRRLKRHRIRLTGSGGSVRRGSGEEDPMGYTSRPGLLVAAAVVAAATAAPQRALGGDDVRRELEELKKQLRALKQQIERQQAIIEKLSAGQPPPQTAPAPASPPPAATAAQDEERLKRQVTEQVLRRIQPSLAAANKTFPAQFNPALGFVIDTVGSYSARDRSNFEFRSGEIGISASVDPFARGYAIINGTQSGVAVEEAAIVTTSLPWNLTVKGGRFFADFGRLSKFHDHDLPFVNRPLALDRFVGGESQADGVEVSWLAPLRQYLTLTAGAYNKTGAPNTRVSDAVPRDFSKDTYLGRAATFFNLSDANG